MATSKLLLAFVALNWCAFSVAQGDVYYRHFKRSTLPEPWMRVKVKPDGLVWVLENRPVELTCTVEDWKDGDPKPFWTKDGMSIGPGSDLELQDPDFADAEEYEFKEQYDVAASRLTSTLIKPSASVGEYHEFMCSLDNGDSDIVQVTVTSVIANDVNISVGFDTSLECRIKTDYKKVRTSWLKDGVPLRDIPEIQDRLKIGDDNQSISFADTEISDGGQYTCLIVFNPDSPKYEQEFEVNVTAYGKPYIKGSENPETLQTITNTSATLLCPARGQPQPQVVWFQGKDILEPTEHIVLSEADGVEGGQLRIQNLTTADLGEFTCTAESSYGKASLSFQVSDPNAASRAMSSLPTALLGAFALVWVVFGEGHRTT